MSRVGHALMQLMHGKEGPLIVCVHLVQCILRQVVELLRLYYKEDPLCRATAAW
jgi:hypothetical protein